jgi:hypothetical protein
MIQRSTFRLGGTYVYVRAGEVRNPARHLMVTRDELETTVVTTEEQLGDVEVLERNRDRWLLVTVSPVTPFYCVGFIAKIASVLSGAGIDILVVSTFSRDWVLVKEGDGPKTVALLEEIGFSNAAGS